MSKQISTHHYPDLQRRKQKKNLKINKFYNFQSYLNDIKSKYYSK